MNDATHWPANRPPEDIELDAKREEWRERYAESDKLAGIEVTENFEPFTQRNDMFTRAFWDADVTSDHTEAFFDSYRVESKPRRGAGFARKDFALRNAAWSVSSIISDRSASEGRREGFQAPIADDSPVAVEPFEFDDPAQMAKEIKEISKLFGADLVGITDYDERWTYKTRVDTRDFSEAPQDLPDGLTSVIVLGHSMDPELVQTYPSALAGAATGLEYSNEAATSIKIATYIRNLGYTAMASMNDTALVIPYAVKAGLGEYGRNQMVITPEFGSQLRFSKIFTNMPLSHDVPKPLGIREYCTVCTKCAQYCPPKALPFGNPDDEPVNSSSIKGVKKWTADCEKCFGYWAKLRTDCAICMRVCPFSRDYTTWDNRLFRRIATSRFRHLAMWWDKRSKRTNRIAPKDWWADLINR